MAFTPILNTEIQTGQAVDNALLAKVKNNFDDHEVRIVILDGQLSIDTTGSRVLMDPEHTHTYATGTTAQDQIDNIDNKLVNLVLTDADLDAAILADRVRLTDLETSQAAQNAVLSNHTSQIADLNTFVINQQTNNTNQQTSINSHDTSINTLTISQEAQDVTLTNYGNRITTLEENDILAFQGCASVNKSNFLTKLTTNGGASLSFVAGATNKTAIGVIRATAASQTIKYNTFIPVNALIGIGGLLTIMAPLATSITFGVECYNSSYQFLSTVNMFSGVAATGAFQKLQGHLINEGLLANNLANGTRFVKPVISFTGNTGNVDIDFLAIAPLMFASYSLYL